MKKIFGLVRSDVQGIRGSVMATCLMIFLVTIPMLFTWFNVLASWDPFANTKNLKIAVASEDEGYESDLFPLDVNVGDQVLNGLRANDQLDWVITTDEDAIDGAQSGEYYASIILPKTFSSDMLTFYANGSKPADIILHTNEKKNALGPTIASRGAEGVTNNIAETFTRTVGDVSLALVASLDDYLDKDDTQAAFDRINARADGLQSQLETGARTARSLSGLVESSIPLVESAQRILNAPRPEIPDLSGSGLDLSTGALDEALSATRQSYDAVGQRIDELYSAADQSRQSRSAALTTLANNVDQNVQGYKDLRDRVNRDVRPALPAAAAELTGRLDEAIAAQESVRDRLRAAAKSDSPEKPDFSSLDRASAAIQGVRDSGLRDQVKELSATLQGIGQDLDISSGSVTLDTDSLQGASQTVNRLADALDRSAQRFGELKGQIEQAGNSGDFSKVAQIVGDNPDALASALASPVEVDRQPVFPVASFGAGMSPLYTSIALWVGALLSVVSMRVGVVKKGLSPLQKYFGRFGIFALIGLLQSTFLMLGLIFFVQIDPAHPFLLIVAGWVSSLVFMMLVYTFVVAFGNSGKALAVLLLVMQISGAGGAYPLPLLSDWIQNISPFLPATYTVKALRAAIGGIYQSDYWIALLTLLLFLIPALFLGIVVRKPLENYNRKMGEALEKTKVM